MCFNNSRRVVLCFITAAVLLCLPGRPASAQVASIALGSTNGVPTLNWADGTWYMRAVELDASNNPVGPITSELSFSLTSEYPNIAVTMAASAPDGNKIRFYRNLGSGFNVGDPNIDYYDQACPIGAVCNAGSVDNIALVDTLSWVPGSVVPVELVDFTVQ